MKDGAVLKACAMVCVITAYGSYLGFSAYCTGEVPDGWLFGTVTLVLGALAGVELDRIVRTRRLKEF